MRRDWQPEELIASWTLIDRDWELLANKGSSQGTPETAIERSGRL